MDLDSHKQNSGAALAKLYPPVSQGTRLNLPSRTSRHVRKVQLRIPLEFWSRIAAAEFHWKTPFTKVLDYNYDLCKGPVRQSWFEDGVTNLCYNCVDRHLAAHSTQEAYFLEGNNVGESGSITYGQLYTEVCKFATVLRTQYGVKKGSVVAMYLPMIDVGPIAMLACARIGAVCNVVFGGFSSQALAGRILDSKAEVLVTADGTIRGAKPIRLKSIADEAIAICKESGLNVKCIVYERLTRDGISMDATRGDAWYQDLMARTPPDPYVEWVEAEHPLFILYTSGSTGKPKGVIHTTGGYMVYAATTFKYVFDHRPDSDVYFSTADIGWITGHTYLVFGPLLNRATSVLFEGIPFHPTPARSWDIIDKYGVTLFYTAPTAIRALMKEGDTWLETTSRHTLRVLGSVGEPINAAAWEWYYHKVGKGKCDIVDTWWQTETGGIMITPLPGCTPMRPGSGTLPFFGIVPAVLDQNGNELEEGADDRGYLVIKHPWPGQARTVNGDHKRYESTYFSQFPGYYFSGDGCCRDGDGYYWITGRVDDEMKVSGHRIGTGEVENAINRHPDVVESAVIGYPHDIKGEGIYAYVTLREGVQPTAELMTSIRLKVRSEVGAVAVPDLIQPAPQLPKTRSGKIMRRILRKIANGEFTELGDTTTLADPSCVDSLIQMHHLWVKQ